MPARTVEGQDLGTAKAGEPVLDQGRRSWKEGRTLWACRACGQPHPPSGQRLGGAGNTRSSRVWVLTFGAMGLHDLEGQQHQSTAPQASVLPRGQARQNLRTLTLGPHLCSRRCLGFLMLPWAPGCSAGWSCVSWEQVSSGHSWETSDPRLPSLKCRSAETGCSRRALSSSWVLPLATVSCPAGPVDSESFQNS